MKYIFRINNIKIKFISKLLIKQVKIFLLAIVFPYVVKEKNFESYKILGSKFIKKIL